MTPEKLLVVLTFALLIEKNLAFRLLTREEQELSEDGRSKFAEIAEKYGHPAVQKDAITEDGYILTMYNLPGDKSRPVLLIHGNTLTCDCWILRGESSLAIVLAKDGYDVWVINMRGSSYSRRHLYLDPDTQAQQFFNFSFYEQGIYDLPAAIDLILQETGQEQLLAIGYSVGTTVLYVMGSERPDYNDKIKVAISLAPICYPVHLGGLLALSRLFAPFSMVFLDFLGERELLKHELFGPLVQWLCLNPLGYEICVKLIFPQVAGDDLSSFEPDYASTFFGHWPGGSSAKTFRHLVQNGMRNEFAKFDYGESKNMLVYGRPDPPPFDLSKVTMKSVLFVGLEDKMSSLEDVERLNASLPNVVHYQVMPYEKFNHFDFAYGRYMFYYLYPYLLPLIEKYT